MKTTPLYYLFGETRSQSLFDGIHMESIADRSQLYDWEITPHRHEDLLQILYINSGSGEVLIGHEKQSIQAPSLIIAPRLIPHGFMFNKDIDGCVITMNHAYLPQLIGFDSLLMEAFEEGRQLSFSGLSTQWQGISNALCQLRNEFAGSDAWRSILVMNHLISFLIQIARSFPKDSLSQMKGSRASSHVERFKKSLDLHYRQHWPIAEYARELGITHTQLNRVCREVLGKSALQVIHGRLITEAERDLSYSSLSIKEIAYTLGFQDEAYFTRFFKKLTQFSPSQFRSNSSNKTAP